MVRFMVLLLLITFGLSAIANPSKFVIGCQWKCGFFSSFFGILNKLAWCERNNRIPVVVWDNHSSYYQPEGFNGSYNAWEYYFLPVSAFRYNHNDPIYREYFAPDGSGIQYQTFLCDDILSYKHWAHALITKYIKIKPIVMQKVDFFYQRHMHNKDVYGIHYRATDKTDEVPQIPLEDIINEAKKYPNVYFFVATDDAHALTQIKRAFPNRVFYYDAYRSDNGTPIHYGNHAISKAKVGEDVLIEVQLLSRCKKLIHTCSNVSCAVLFFNPTMENVLLVPH